MQKTAPSPARLAGLDTPALVLDRTRLAANVERMAARAALLGVALRPHLKTAKSADVALAALGGVAGPITVSTLAEAEYFFHHGFDDILYAVAIAPGKLARVAALGAAGCNLTLVTDTVEAASAIAAFADGEDAAFSVLIEVDCGQHRGGVRADGEALMQIADALTASPRVALRGVMAHAGHSYDCRDEASMVAVAEDERRAAVTAAGRLRAAGHAAPVVSVGSTPTALFAKHLDGVTEMRPGVYMFSDLFQAGIGTSTLSDLAVSVLATVIGRNEDRNAVLIDAGGMALSKDRSGAALSDDPGYGLVCDAKGGRVLDDLFVADVNQEHGWVTTRSNRPFDFAAWPVGTRLRVLPNHVCMMAAAYGVYHVTDGDDAIVARWGRCSGW